MRSREFITISETPLDQYTPFGDFSRPGPFKAIDRKLVTHPTNQLKTAKFFSKSPYDFRLFFSNVSGTGKYGETGAVSDQQLISMFGDDQASQILEGSKDENAITVVFVGNSGDRAVMMTPWIMAHRLGHAIQVGSRVSSGRSNNAWAYAEQHFFRAINEILAQYYGIRSASGSDKFQMNLSSEYTALFNAIGTQRSSRENQVRRPYEFMYEMFAQYLGSGTIKFNPLPKNLGYGRKVFGRTVTALRGNPEGAEEFNHAANTLSYDMEIMFNDVLGSCAGRVFVM